MSVRRFVALAATALVALSLSACASESPVEAQPTPVDTVAPAILSAAWLDGGRYIGIVTEGSSTCVPETSGVVVEDDGTLAVTFAERAVETPCTADLAPRVSLAWVPEGVDATKDIDISVTGDGVEGSITLAGVEFPASGEPSDVPPPSAGWTDIDGTFVVLLWGSSTCAEHITATEVTGAASVRAYLSGIPSESACTADLAPNAALAVADGLQGVEDVELTVVLSPEDGDEVTIPILGVDAPA